MSSTAEFTPSEAASLTRLCYLLMVSVSFPMNLLAIILSSLKLELSMTEEEAGRASFLGFIGVIVSVSMVSPFADRFGAKPFVVLGCFSGALGFLLQTVASNYWILCAALFIEGLGLAQLDLMASPIVAALNVNDRTSNLQKLHAFFSIGAVGTTLLSSVMIGQGLNWRVLTVVGGVFYGALGLRFLFQKVPAIVEDAHGVDEPWGQLVGSRTFWIAFAVIALGGASELGPVVWIPSYFSQVLLLPEWMSGLALTGFSIFMATGRLIGGRYGAQLGYDFLVGKAAMLCCVAVLGVVYAPWTWLSFICASVIGITISAMWPAALAIAGDCHPNGGAKMFCMLSVAGNGGGGGMPWIVGVISDATHSLKTGFTACVVPPLLLVLIMMTFQKNVEVHRKGRTETSPEPTDLEEVQCTGGNNADLGQISMKESERMYDGLFDEIP
jgi:fucose permease